MLKFKTTFLLLISLFFITDAESNAGKTSCSFLKIGIGARALSMGSAFVSVADDPTTIYWNPAGLAQIKQGEGYFSHNQSPLQTTQEFLGFTQPLSSTQSLGIGINYLHSDEIERRTGPADEPIGSFNTSDIDFSLAYALRLIPRFSLGITSNFIQERLEDEKAAVFALDIGGLYKSESLSLGLNLQNIGRKIRFVEKSYPLPLVLKTGISCKIRDNVTLALDVDKFLNEHHSKLHLGIEYPVLNSLALRGGYSKSLDSRQDLREYSFGIGFCKDNFKIDYAFLPLEDLGSTHQFSLAASLPTPEPRPKPVPVKIKIETVALESIFPSKYRHYANVGLGSITITNEANNSISGVKVTFHIPGYMELPTEYEIPMIEPHSSATVSLKPIFNQQIFSAIEDTPVSAQIKVIHQGKETLSQVVSLTLQPRNLIDWRQEENISAFVTPNDESVKFFTKKVVGASKVSSDLPVNLFQAMELFAGLSNLPLSYLSDPKMPCKNMAGEKVELDTVQYPSETLGYGKGDCDDLSVLFSACLESIGIETALVMPPEHIFVMFDTGIHPKNASLISSDTESFIFRNDRIWLPIETTLLQKSFVSAWQEGIVEYQNWQKKNKIRVIALKEAWEIYPPVPLPQKDQWRPNIPDIETKVEEYINEFNEYRRKTRANAYNQQGIDYSLEGNYDSALERFKKVLEEFDDKNSAAYNNLANIYCLKGELEEAEKAYEKALNYAPTDAGIYLNLGIYYKLLDEEQSAIEMFSEALRLLPDNNSAYKILGLDREEVNKTAAEKKMKLSPQEIKYLLEKAREKVPNVKPGETIQKPALTPAKVIRMRDILLEGEGLIRLILYWK